VTEHVADADLQERFAEQLFDVAGIDVRGQRFRQFLRANITGAASVTLIDGHPG
jgi:hypothetical protein